MICKLCNVEKEEAAFCPNERRRLSHRCNACMNSQQRKRLKEIRESDPAAWEKFRVANRASHHRNKHKYKARQVRHYLENHDRYMFYKTKAFAKKRGATEFLTFAEWKLLRSRTECHWCAMTLHQSFTNVDHIVPLCEGGQHTLDNLALSCANCNLRREWMRKVKYEQVKGV